MCILCVIQKWSRRVATMLPWLVIPLIGLWALSQLLPPAFRFEITSPRLACVFVLLVTLFWYEILMPQLSAWRLRRNARLRERKRFEAIELQKLRKTATKRCRNCLTPYRDQNPGGGKFMCSYCGHISKRPVLEMSVPPGLGIPNSGIIKDLVGKGGKILNGKAWSDNGWMCSQDWLDNGGWAGGSFAGRSSYWRKSGGGNLGADDNCLAEKSVLRVVIFGCKLLTSFFLSIRWLCRKIFRISSSEDDASADAERRGGMPKRGENGANYPESRGEKARRKAEEKRQARLERELLEEEERKQREEVARLVEERRRLRDEKMEAEKDRSKLSPPTREKDSKKEAEKRRQDRRRDKDKGSSKSNSDVEELEKRAGKESERKRDFDKKGDAERRESQKFSTEHGKGYNSELGYGNGMRNASTTNFSRGNAGTRYFDRMRGTFLSSSRAFGGNSFFGQNANSPAAGATKEMKFNSSVDQLHTSAHRRETCSSGVVGKSSINCDDKNSNRPGPSEQPRTAPKKSWQQLFTRSSSSASSSSSTNVISRPNPKPQAELQNPQLSGQQSSIQSFKNPINFGLPSTFSTPMYPNVSSSTSLGFSPAIESSVPHIAEGLRDFLAEEPERFEDPCYVPDPVSLLGPVSESLDNFQLDMGTGFASDLGLDRPRAMKKAAGSPEVSKPSPIESPLSRRIADEKHNNASWFPTTPKAQDLHANNSLDDVQVNHEKGTWQMWNSVNPLGQDGLGLVGGPGNWLLPPERSILTKEDILHPSSQNMMAASLFSTDDHVLLRSLSPQKGYLRNGHGGVFSPVASSGDNEPWLHKSCFPPLSGNEGHFSVKAREESCQDEVVMFGSPNGAASNLPFEMPPQDCWSKKDWAVQGTEGVVKPLLTTRPAIGGLFSNPNPDVQSLW
ncbi:unnamed protein product [Linum tenue]|uniref:Stress response NST1-like protein n=2 Tax=Linum tenue TaxID=586396 RepID=A0AAV0KSR8_9ROSI|nr:unnamed protein product [Linum tenue]